MSTVRKFREWTDGIRRKFVVMAGDIPDDSGIFVDVLTTQTVANLAEAEAKYSRKIIQLENDKGRWEKRFGTALAVNLDEPPQKSAYWLVGVVLFLVAVESIANSQFFAPGSEYGLLGGTLTAITVSFGNVFIPLGLAFLGHRWFYRYDSYRALGIVVVGLFLLWAFGFNHLVAQYRESLLAAASQDSSTLHYVLLFALGVAVAGISFWKMWSFLDPYKQARKCSNDLQINRENFEKDACVNLITAQNKCNDVITEIKQMETEIFARFRQDESDFSRVHSTSIAETNKIFARYHQEYCPMKVDPDPEQPFVTLENAAKYGVGISDAEKRFFAEMKTLLDGLIDTATREWILKLHDILQQIGDLIKRFKEVVTAKLLEWGTPAQPA